MDVQYSARGVGVGPGRKPKEAPEEILDILRETYENGTQANVDIRGVDQAEVSEFCTMLINGARQLGRVGRVYGARSGIKLRFWMEDEDPA